MDKRNVVVLAIRNACSVYEVSCIANSQGVSRANFDRCKTLQDYQRTLEKILHKRWFAQ